MNRDAIAAILDGYKRGELGLEAALAEFRDFPTKSLGYATLDTHRELRVGFPEVVYCAGKSPEQVSGILAEMMAGGRDVLATRASDEHFAAAAALSPDFATDPVARTIVLRRSPEPDPAAPYAAVVSAGTSDASVAEEAAVTIEAFGLRAERVADVGVAGIHRLLERLPLIRGARAVVAVAGMEGALASVIGGLVEVPVVAVPTSVGYGASLGGIAALLAMINSCASNVSVVNIDNGFGAGYIAAVSLRNLMRR
jgi:pyridinium-3,5-biscarboxylic acid mononucleotide synthase